jgi:FkbM family methyltransferase
VSMIMAARSRSRTALNAIAKLFGVRVVSARWGPRGFRVSLAKTRAQGFSPATVIDVGASNGQWTHECRQIFPGARYLLVDPLEENRPTLDGLALSDSRIEVWHGALGAVAGQLDLWAHGDQSSFLRSSDFPGRRRAVELRTLDSFIGTHSLQAPVLLKADVQGYELEVLKGASRCLDMCEVLLIEVSFRRLYEDSPLAHDIVGYLGSKGFRVYDICSFVQRPADNELVQCDIVFAREGSKLFAYEGWA